MSLMYEVIESNERIALFEYKEDAVRFVLSKSINSDGLTVRCGYFKVIADNEEDENVGC